MKITLDTPDRLIVDHGPWRLLAAVFAFSAALLFWGFDHGIEVGAVVSVLVFGMAWMASRRLERVRLVLDRSDGSAEIRRRARPTGPSRVRYDLAEVTALEVIQTRGGRSTYYRLELAIANGPHAGRHPLNRLDTGDERSLDVAARVNRWLTDNA